MRIFAEINAFYILTLNLLISHRLSFKKQESKHVYRFDDTLIMGIFEVRNTAIPDMTIFSSLWNVRTQTSISRLPAVFTHSTDLDFWFA